MFRGRECAVFYGDNVAFYRALNVVLPFHEVFHELWCSVGHAQAKHVVQHQHLSISIRSCSDANDRN